MPRASSGHEQRVLCGVCEARLLATGARFFSRAIASVPNRLACGARRCKGGEAAAVRALRGGEPSCAAASQAETSGTVGSRPEQSSLRRRNELEGRGCALFLSPVGHEADEPAAQEGARGKQFWSAAIFGHSRALRETEKPAAQEGARGRKEPTPWTMLLMGSLTLACIRARTVRVGAWMVNSQFHL